MYEARFRTSSTPSVTVRRCSSDLVVRGAKDGGVVVRTKGSADDLEAKQDDDGILVESRSGCLISCPPASDLTIHTISGNLKMTGIAGLAAVDTVFGNTTLRDVGAAQLTKTMGNLQVWGVKGTLKAQQVQGNVKAQGVSGSLHLAHVAGNLAAAGLGDGMRVDRVQGNVTLGPPFPPGASYCLEASGNLHLHLPLEPNLRLKLHADGGIDSQVPGLELAPTDENDVQATLGRGEASLEATVRGHISLQMAESDEEPDFGWGMAFADDLDGLGVAIESRIAEAMEAVETRLDESLRRVSGDRFRRKVEQAAERAGRAAERAADQVRREAEREAERARMRAERAERRWKRVSGAPEPDVSDEERLRVLRMVEEGKITPAQAADLLAALEGR